MAGKRKQDLTPPPAPPQTQGGEQKTDNQPTLKGKQRRFVDAYFECGYNATKAAIAAGYSPLTARQQGSRLLTNVDIAKAVDDKFAEQAMKANEVLARLAHQARGDMREFIGVDYGDLKHHPSGFLIKKVKRTVERSVVKVGDEEFVRLQNIATKETFEIELYDAQAAQVHIGKHHKLFTEKTDITSDGQPIAINVQKVEARAEPPKRSADADDEDVDE